MLASLGELCYNNRTLVEKTNEENDDMLELIDVRKTYQTKAGVVNALDGVSLTFPSTGLVFITGKSGCGKTTLLNVIGGLDGIDEGEIIVQDKKFSSFSAQEYDSYRNTFIGFIFQEYNLLPEYSVEKNIKIAMELQGGEVDEAEYQKLLNDVEIAELKDRNPSELSGGQRQRVAIARALIKHPRIIMADEPTGALDSGTGVQVLETLKKLSKEKLVIVVSHDNEFAEKYADRIIHLVDGKVAEDITFSENQISANVSTQENAILIREGAALTESEKDELAVAIYEKKKIEVIKNLTYRDRDKTGKVEREDLAPIALKKSKMKLRSAFSLGVKSLVVKPVRLVITILISALAFGVFGLFDSVASFERGKILKNLIQESPASTVVTSGEYIVDYEAGDTYGFKFSKDTVVELGEVTGGTVKGIFNFNDNISGNVGQPDLILDLHYASVMRGRNYYSYAINGCVEFDVNTEISADNTFKDFNYRLVAGKYPVLTYSNGIATNESLKEVAISTYLAESILFYLPEQKLNDEKIEGIEGLLDKTLRVNSEEYKIVGLIDCGDIPEKYDLLKTTNPSNVKTQALNDDFKAYINSTAHKCFFVGAGYLEAMNKKNVSADIHYIGDADMTVLVDKEGAVSRAVSSENYVYSCKGYGVDNILFFDGQYPKSKEIELGANEVLVHPNNLMMICATEINQLRSQEKATIRTLLEEIDVAGSAQEARLLFDDLRTFLASKGILLETSGYTAKLSKVSTETGKRITQDVKIVGFYYNVDKNVGSTVRYKMMMSNSLMSTFDIWTQQGDYCKVLFSPKSLDGNSQKIAGFMVKENGFSLVWYNNPALSIINDNEDMIRQAANLFLYVALLLLAFSIFMLYNYISTSIASKKQSIGVLRGLGAGGKDILRTFLSESLVIGVINGVLAVGLTVLGCSIVNSYIMNTMNIFISFAIFGIRQVFVITGVSLLTVVLASVLPIIKISKRKPVDLIRRP